jgi:hypothetical protein
MFTVIGSVVGLIIVGVGVYKVWKGKGSKADKIAKTAEDLAKAAELAKTGYDAGKQEGFWKKK